MIKFVFVFQWMMDDDGILWFFRVMQLLVAPKPECLAAWL